jgi:hypothetical protein
METPMTCDLENVDRRFGSPVSVVVVVMAARFGSALGVLLETTIPSGRVICPTMSVTAAMRARRRPLTTASMVAVMLWSAIIVPSRTLLAPRVPEEPT